MLQFKPELFISNCDLAFNGVDRNTHFFSDIFLLLLLNFAFNEYHPAFLRERVDGITNTFSRSLSRNCSCSRISRVWSFNLKEYSYSV